MAKIVKQYVDDLAAAMAASSKELAQAAVVQTIASPGFLAAQSALVEFDKLPLSSAEALGMIKVAIQTALSPETHRRLWKGKDANGLVSVYDAVTLVYRWLVVGGDHPGHGRIRWTIAVIAYIAASNGRLPADGELSLKALGGK